MCFCWLVWIIVSFLCHCYGPEEGHPSYLDPESLNQRYQERHLSVVLCHVTWLTSWRGVLCWTYRFISVPRWKKLSNCSIWLSQIYTRCLNGTFREKLKEKNLLKSYKVTWKWENLNLSLTQLVFVHEGFLHTDTITSCRTSSERLTLQESNCCIRYSLWC